MTFRKENSILCSNDKQRVGVGVSLSINKQYKNEG